MPPELLEGETVLGGWPSNQLRHGIAVGGQLWLTSERVVFVPNRVERSLGRKGWAWDLSDIAAVRLAPCKLWPLSALRRRLILLGPYGDARFFVSAVDEVVSSIEAAIGNP